MANTLGKFLWKAAFNKNSGKLGLTLLGIKAGGAIGHTFSSYWGKITDTPLGEFVTHYASDASLLSYGGADNLEQLGWGCAIVGAGVIGRKFGWPWIKEFPNYYNQAEAESAAEDDEIERQEQLDAQDEMVDLEHTTKKAQIKNARKPQQ